MGQTETGPLSVGEWPLLSTTTVLLIASRVLLPTVGLDATKRVLESTTPWCPPYRTSVEVDRIARAANGVGSRLPLSFTCLMRALVVQSLFAAHGHPSEIHVGVAKDADGLRAHAWIEREGSVVIGELNDLSEYQSIVRLS